MRKLDFSRPYGRITPPHNGAFFEQDGMLFNQHYEALTSEAPQPAAGAADSGFALEQPDGDELQLPHAAAETTDTPESAATESAPSDATNKPAPNRHAHALLRTALRELTGHAPRSRKQLADEVERLTGVRPETQQDGLDLLKAEGLWTE